MSIYIAFLGFFSSTDVRYTILPFLPFPPFDFLHSLVIITYQVGSGVCSIILLLKWQYTPVPTDYEMHYFDSYECNFNFYILRLCSSIKLVF